MKHRMQLRPCLLIHQAPRLEEAPEPWIAMGPRTAKHQTVHSPRLLDRECLADGTSGGQPDEMRALDVERIHEARELRSHLVH